MTSEHASSLLSKNDGTLFTIPEVLYGNMYCNQDDFSILILRGRTTNSRTQYWKTLNKEALNDVYEIKGQHLECNVQRFLKARYDCKTAVINSDILVVGGYNTAERILYSVEIVQNNRKSWCYKTKLSDTRNEFSVCTFKQNLYIIGGRYEHFQKLKSCLAYDVKCDRWSQIANMNEKIKHAACTVYEGKIVVTGGDNNERYLKSVEAYDYYENK